MEKKRIAAYTKISKSDVDEYTKLHQEQFESLIAKREDCELVDFYCDLVTSRNSKGWAFDKMLKDAAAHKFDYLLIKSVSRLSRKPTDAMAMLKRLKDLGIVVYFVQENVSTKDEKFDLLMSIMDYSEQLGTVMPDLERAAMDEEYENSCLSDEE